MNLQVVYFYVCAVMAVLGALATVVAENPIRGALGLLLTIGGVAALFLSLHAEFLAAVQLIVYAGAVVILFLFVIMLLGPAAVPPKDNKAALSRAIGAIAMAVVGLFGFITALVWNGSPVAVFPDIQGDEGTIEAMAKEVFGRGLVPFELSSALLIVAVVGAVAIARGRQGEPAKHASDRQLLNAASDDPSLVDPKTKHAPVATVVTGHGGAE